MNDLLLGNFILFILINSVTPGPNNLMLLHGGLKAGFRACYPHLFGISAGLVVMLAFSYLGMATIVTQLPVAMTGLKIIGTSYLLWLAWHMWIDGIVPDDKTLTSEQQITKKGRFKRYFQRWTLPLNVWQAALFQWVNPKAWLMAAVAPSVYLIAGDQPLLDNLPLCGMAFFINQCCISVWAAGGHGLQRLLHKQRLMRVIHIVIVLMTVYCGVSLWLD
ncbi:MAG: hypothetical protein CR963_00730 [Gammaproteobacteria bacterium]|nr:MAG: hypothetical protein CR963_00730 [Gammaproteobacteria bacterium]